MFSSSSAGIIITGLTSLAGTVIELWKIYRDSQENKINRQHQKNLQDAHHEHEILLENFRNDKNSFDEILNLDDSIFFDDELIKRLNWEALKLDEMGMDVIYEPISTGYGLALLIDKRKTIVFWLSDNYPSKEPKILINIDNKIENITFEDGVWDNNFALADIVNALSDYS